MQDKNIQIVDFTPEHLERMELRPEDERDLGGLDRRQAAARWPGGRTILWQGEPAFLYTEEYESGVVSWFAFSSPLAARLPLFLTRLARGVLNNHFAAGAHRIQAYCHADNVRSRQWLTCSLGFCIEGMLRRSGPDAQDRFILSIVKEDWEVLPWAR